MTWSFAEARRRFAAVLEAAAGEPQVVAKRGRPVAAIISLSDLEALQGRRQGRWRDLAEALTELSKTCSEERYELEVPRTPWRTEDPLAER